LARYFDRVIATDPSEAQLSRAKPHERIEYRLARAESSGVARGSIDLVTAAQALHWFDAATFFGEAKRVLAPAGAIAVWGYGDPRLDTPALDFVLRNFNRGLLEPYWYPERNLVLDGYRTIPFPFAEAQLPTQTLEMQWTLPELAGYLRTWSAAARYVDEHGIDPVVEVEKELARDWGDPDHARLVRWPLYIRAGTVADISMP
jgi:SAM-dependent methyltransferase